MLVSTIHGFDIYIDSKDKLVSRTITSPNLILLITTGIGGLSKVMMVAVPGMKAMRPVSEELTVLKGMLSDVIGIRPLKVGIVVTIV